jgi:hypothetical protein
MIHDQRPVLEQVRSGFKIAGILVVLTAALSVLATFFPIYRAEALWWHLRHGHTIQVGEFRVPVPTEWYVSSFEAGPSQEVELVNTKGGRALWATIDISEQSSQHQNQDLDELARLRQRSMGNLGVHVTDLRQLPIGGVGGFCVDGETAMAGLPVRNISCRWRTGFSVEYIGSPLKAPSLYSILAGISVAPRK